MIIIPLLFSVGLVFATQDFTETTYSIPVIESGGHTRMLETRVCFPKSSQAARVVILNHGSPPSAKDRPFVEAYHCDSEAPQWFLAKGYIVMSPLRRGYGATGGSWEEKYGGCDNPDYVRAGLETARDIKAAVDFVPKLPNAKPDQITVVGQSAGGWGVIALNSVEHSHVTALINMAGGRGGHHGPNADQNCAPDKLAAAAAQFGKTSNTPMIWIYSENDSFFSPIISKSLYEAFSKSGGKAQFILKPPFKNDGHSEFSAKGGTQVWGKDVELYLSKQQR